MNEQTERLAEGIIEIAAHCVSIEEEPLCCWCAEKMVTLIGKAVADGELELPGEETRLDADEWWIEKPDDVITFPEGTILIALRPLSGTGKEEEK